MGRKRKRQADELTGIILVAKPSGLSSRQVVVEVQRRLRIKGLGHCGTLDPLATGLLVLVAGRASRLQEGLTGHDKVYVADIRLGERSESDDGEGPIWATEPVPILPDEAAVREALKGFIGAVAQRAPIHSAVKVGGERLFKKARRGDEVEAPMRQVRIDRIDILALDGADLRIEVACGPGTYIRSLARDLGDVLGTGAYLSGLVRTQSGPFQLADATPLDDLEREHLTDLEDALVDFPRVVLHPEDLRLFLNGRPLESRCDEVVQENALIWFEGRIVGRARRLSPRTYRLDRLLYDAPEVASSSRLDSDRMSPPTQGDPDR